ncbi:MAG: hypothetical protein AB1609_22550, partial [Bacillota bacterium]
MGGDLLSYGTSMVAAVAWLPRAAEPIRGRWLRRSGLTPGETGPAAVWAGAGLAAAARFSVEGNSRPRVREGAPTFPAGRRRSGILA